MIRLNHLLFALFFFGIGCSKELPTNIPNLKEGEFEIRVYDIKGALLLSKKGEAEYIGKNELRLTDTTFIQPNVDPLKTFAAFYFILNTTLTSPKELILNSNSTASFTQRWYSLSDDWGYTSAAGKLTISSIVNSKVKGSFEVNLDIADGFGKNPLWGEHIVVKGSFSTK
jgi:hypothetical protein